MIINDDILHWASSYDGSKFHAVLCDPPYELGFMGKSWDSTGIAFSKDTWAAISRHLYPGAYLLAFGGTRTFHRIAVAIEDAGFEIRDTIMFVFGSGFPKSHNLGCKCQRGAVQYTHNEGTETESEHDLRPVQKADLPSAECHGEKQDEVLQSSLPESITGEQASSHAREHSKAKNVRSEESGVEGRSDILEKARELQANKVHPMSEGVSADGTEGRVYNGTPPDSGTENRATSGKDGSSASHQPRPARQSAGESYALCDESTAQNIRGQECPKCGGLMGWEGRGSALKPAYEPIIVARKPLDGTMKDNALKYGSGALWIDGCRVDFVSEEDKGDPKRYQKTDGGTFLASDPKNTEVGANGGRWPANLIHDGSDEVVGMFPNSGGGAFPKKINGKSPITFRGDEERESRIEMNDAGSAARFFQNCPPDDLLLCDAKAIMDVCKNDVNTAKSEWSRKGLGGFAQSLAPIVGRVGASLSIQNSQGLSMNATESELGMLCESVITATLYLERNAWLVPPQEKPIPNGSHVSIAGTLALTGTTTITISHWKSDGSADGAMFVITPNNMAHGEKDSASRFRYSAKVSKRERDAGLKDEFQIKRKSHMQTANGTGQRSMTEGFPDTFVRNHHPTLKPIALTTYLAKLILPPKLDQPRRLLVPFSGAGSEVIGALKAGWDEVVGVEQDKEYCKIAEARIKHWTKEAKLAL